MVQNINAPNVPSLQMLCYQKYIAVVKKEKDFLNIIKDGIVEIIALQQSSKSFTNQKHFEKRQKHLNVTMQSCKKNCETYLIQYKNIIYNVIVIVMNNDFYK